MSSPRIKTLCVYGSASDGVNKEYHNDIVQLGYEAARRGCDLVYGGGTTGHMGAFMEGMYRGGAHITAIIPDYIIPKEMRDRPGRKRGGTEDPSTWIDECIVLEGEDQRAVLQARQRLMEERADAIIATTGGDVTFAELFELLGWKKYNLTETPVVLFDSHEQWKALVELRSAIKSFGYNKGHSKRTGEENALEPYVYVKTIDDALAALKLMPNDNPRPEGRPKETRWTSYKVRVPELILNSKPFVPVKQLRPEADRRDP